MKIESVLQLIIGTNGSGKAQPLSALIKTPGGWSTMGDMKVGTEVIAKDGTITTVTGVFPKGNKEIYKITFADGRTTECCEDHLWKIYIGGKKYPIEPKIVDTKELISWLNTKTYSKLIWIDLVDSEKNENIALPIDPYLLGIFLGDGCSRSNTHEKLIPEIYLHASREQRLSLAQGLLDTDGTINSNGTVSFCSTSEQLARGMQYLIRSLGGIASISTKNPNYTHNGERKTGRIAYQVNIRYKKSSELFRLPKKKERANDDNRYSATLKLRVVNVEKIGYKEAQCISIAHPEHLYVTDSFIVTHNSSLLHELSPLPADKGDFTKTGGKEIHIEHQGIQYVLSSDFSRKHTHSFLIGEVEQNPGGTVSIQKELVQKYFSINTEIHALLQGKETFTNMDAQEKRKWFLRLSDTNYDYAIRIYNKLKEKQRDVSGAIRLSKKTLVAESEKLLQDRELEALEIETKELHTALNHLLEYRKPVEHDLDKLSIQQDRYNKTLFELSNNLLDTKEKLDGLDHSEADYAVELSAIEKDLIGLSVLNSQFTQIHQDNSIKINILQKAQAKTVEQLHNDAQSLYTAVQASISTSLIRRMHPDPIGALNAYNALQPALLDIAAEIPLNVDKKYSQEEYLLAKDKLVVLTAAKEGVLFRQTKCRTQLDHLEKHKESPTLECPKCEHRFSPHYSEEKYLETKKELLKYTEELETVCYPAISECEAYIETCGQYARQYRQYVQLCNSSPILLDYWNILTEKRVYTDYPDTAIHELNAIRNDLEMQVTVNNQTKKLAELEETIKSLESVGAGDLPSLLKANAEIEEKISSYTEQIRTSQYRKNVLTNTLKTYADISKILGLIKETIQSKRKLNQNELETVRRNTLNGLIRDLQSLLATKEHTYGMASKQKGIVDRLAKDIEQYGIAEEAIGHLVRELSPTEGLIAEGLLGFIKNFCDQMNGIIAKIWSYELKVLSCEAIDGETIDLDYKFGMQVENVADPIKDVKMGSTGMIEIINLAFRLTAMSYLGLQDSPLYMDEAGASFDAKHKTATVYMIKSLIEQSSFSQIFMISHDYAQYGALSNAQICALSTNNVVVPEKYNLHVKMS